jgi:hypothetical protein
LPGALSRKRGLATTSRASPRPKAATRERNNIAVFYQINSVYQKDRDTTVYSNESIVREAE